MLRHRGFATKLLTVVLLTSVGMAATGCSGTDRAVGRLVPSPATPTSGPATPTPAPGPGRATPVPAATATPSPTSTPDLERPPLPEFELEPSAPGQTSVLSRMPDLTGESLRVVARNAGAAGLREALDVFAQATGATVELETGPNPAAMAARATAAGAPPDVAVVAQKTLMLEFVDAGRIHPMPASIAEVVDADFDPTWAELVSVDGRRYGVPNNATVKSLVWYRPGAFAELGYRVPTTWDELDALQAGMRAEAHVPWCIGNASESGGGWPFTDWIEDVVLRRYGPEVYDQWTRHEIGFDDPRIIEAIETVSAIWFEPGNTFGGRATVATSSWRDAGLPLLDGDCLLHRQAGFYADIYRSAGARLGSDEDVFAFALPPIGDDFGRPIIGEGDWFAAFTDRPATWALMRYLASSSYADTRILADAGGFVSSNRTHDTDLYESEIDRLMGDLLVSDGPVRFDASAQMPPVVGSDEFWRAGSAYVWGQITVVELVDRVEAAWPRQDPEP